MQNQNNVMPSYQNWASLPSTTMDSWMDMTAGVDSMLSGIHDFEDPLNMSNPTGYMPPPDQMNWAL
jgi:hypothetical protein